MFEQAFRNIDNALRQDAGCTTELDYTEQTSWLLFLKYLDGLEHERALEAQMQGQTYTPILAPEYQWGQWAAPRKQDQPKEIDHAAALTGDDLKDFVDSQLFPYLKSFKQTAASPDTIEYKIGEVFSEITNKLQSGYTLRDVIDHVHQLRFGSQQEKHELSELYEAKIKNMGNAGRNGGEYYTPRPLIRAMIKVIDPQIGETIYDPACGSAGFLCESYEHLYRERGKLSTNQLRILQESTFFGKEKKSLAYCLGIMNMILHGVAAPNLVHTNTLTENLADVQAKDQYDIVLANPPFGGNERAEIRQNFPVSTGETAFLFLQHFIKRLKPGGRAGVVIKNTFLSNADTAAKALRHQLLTDCNLFTILDCPQGTFQGAGVKTVVLFFDKGRPTDKVWYYQLDPGRTLGKTNPLNDEDLADFVEKHETFADSDQSWFIDGAAVAADTAGGHELSVKNPNAPEADPLRDPAEVIAEIKQLDEETAAILEDIGGML